MRRSSSSSAARTTTPALARYVNSIGQFLAAASDAPQIGYTFTILDSPVVNAFAVPGGYVYVTRGLLALAGTEAEVAGVLAHEIAHITLRHGAKRQSKGTLAGLGLAVLGAVTDNPLLADLGRIGAHAVLSGYSRAEEHEADEFGVTYLSRAGFDPGAMSSFLDTLRRHSKLESAIHGRTDHPGLDFFATHPRTRDRVARAVAAARRTVVTDPIRARNIFLAKIDGLIYGDSPKQGFVRGRRFLHPDIGFEFVAPPRFRLLNGERSITGFGPGESRMQFDMHPIPRGRSLARYLRKDWAPRAKVRRPVRFTVNGMRAVTATARESRDRSLRLVAIRFRPDTVARFVFVLPEGTVSEHDVRAAVHSFRRLSEVEAQALRPFRIAIHEVKRRETVNRLVDRKLPGRDCGAVSPVPGPERPAAGRASSRAAGQADCRGLALDAGGTEATLLQRSEVTRKRSRSRGTTASASRSICSRS